MTYQYHSFIPTRGYSLGITGVVIPPRIEVRRRLTVKLIQETVANYYGLHTTHMTGQSKESRHARPRQVAMYLAREMIGRSTPDIGRMFGGRDHTTVLHALSAVRDRMATDGELADDIDELKARLRG
jgi:chromosomal replication initiator protein